MVNAKKIERWSPLKVWLYSLGARTPARSLAAVEILGLGATDRFIDLGCGLGAGLEHAVATGAVVSGIDPSPAMVARAAERVPLAQVRVGAAEAIPFADGSFTAAMAVATFHHWSDPGAGLLEVRRVLTDNGRLLIMERHLRSKKGHGLHPDAAAELLGELSDLGFRDGAIDLKRVETGSFMTIAATKGS